MMKTLILILALGVTTTGRAADISDYNVIWDSPSANSLGSMPIGNGDIGANVWVEPSGDLVLLLSKTDAWSGNGRLLKLGRVRIQTDPPICKPGDKFTQRLDLKGGTIVIQDTIRVWIDANQPVIRVEVNREDPVMLTVQHETWRTERRQLRGGELGSAYGIQSSPNPVWVEADTVLDGQTDRIVFFHRNVESIWANNLRLQALDELVKPGEDPLLHQTFGAIVQAPGLVNDGKNRLVSKSPTKQCVISIFPVTARTPTAEAWVNEVTKLAKDIASQPLDAARTAHAEWWREFWNRSWISASGPADAGIVTRGYMLQRWMNACAGRGASPIKFNGSIFNVDVLRPINKQGPFDADYRAWGGCYWFQNTRLPYWSMLAAGDYDLMQPLFKMYMDALPLRKVATKKYYNHDGAFFPETIYFWGTWNNDNYGWNRKGKPDGLSDNQFIRREWQGSIELVAMMLDYYAQTQDAKFRDKTLLPFAAEIIAFYDQHYPRTKEGMIRMHPAQALETWWDCTNPMPEVAGLHAVLPRLIALTGNATQQAAWRKTLHDLPPVPMGEANGKRYLVPAEKSAGRHNSENPELYAIFPYRLYGLGNPDLDIALEAWRRRQVKRTGGWSQDAIQAALLGLTNEAQKDVTTNFGRTASGFRFQSIWGPNFDWVPDQDHGSVALIALQTMLLQTAGDKILLLPAWPKDWNVSFKLHAPQNTTVEGVYRDGKMQELKVTPASRKKDVVLPSQPSTSD